MKTYAPSFTNCFAVARPMPLLPPVTSAIFPSSLPMYVLLTCLFEGPCLSNSLDLICSLLESSENERRVRTAETETVRECVLDIRLARFVRHIIQVAFRVGILVVNRRW